MEESLRLGNIAGVRVGINWSVLVVFLLIAVGLAAGRFPVQAPGFTLTAYVIAGVLAAVVFFFSLLAHEVAHAVVARRYGVPVEGITLWLFGGVARLRGDAPTPQAALRIAAVGPLVSLQLAVGFFALGFFARVLTFPKLVISTLIWLAIINLSLGIFNLAPAAPLDGGRILQAVLWQRRGDQTSASVTASRAGRAFGLGLVGLGLVMLVTFVGFGGLWLVLLGWYIFNVAGAEEHHAAMRGALIGVRVSDVMTANPTVAPAELSVEELLDQYVLRYRYSAFPLVDEQGRFAGLVTLNGVKQIPAHTRAATAVLDAACPPAEVPLARPGEPLADLLPRMEGCADGRALVVDQGRIVGIVSPTDVARLLSLADIRPPRQITHR